MIWHFGWIIGPVRDLLAAVVDHSIETERAEPESRAADASWRALAPLIYPCVIAGLRQTTRSVLGSGGGAPVSAARRRGPRQPAIAPSARGGKREHLLRWLIAVLDSLSTAPLRDVSRCARRRFRSHASVGDGGTWSPTTGRQWRGCRKGRKGQRLLGSYACCEPTTCFDRPFLLPFPTITRAQSYRYSQ